MAVSTMANVEAGSRPKGQKSLFAGRRIAIGAAGGLMPLFLAMAVVQGAPVVEAFDTILRGWRGSLPDLRAGSALLLGLSLQAVVLASVGALWAVYRRGAGGVLDLFQSSLVLPSMLFVVVQVIGFGLATDLAGTDRGDARFRISGVAADSGAAVRIIVYEQRAPDPLACLGRGLLNRGCSGRAGRAVTAGASGP